MSKDSSPKVTENAPASGLGLEKFAMSAVGASETREASEISRRWTRTLVGIVLFALALAAGIWWFTAGRDLLFHPSQQDEQFILSLRDLDAARAGTISDFKFVGVNALKFQISPRFNLSNKENQLLLRQAVVPELVAAFTDYREGAAVRVTGYQGEEKAVEGHRLQKANWQGRSLLEAFRRQERELPVGIHISGETMGPDASE
jgi:hypothetical protein